jgi:ribonuclease P protein component
MTDLRAHHTAFAVVIGKKYAKNATTRNALKRKIYAAIQYALQKCGAPPEGRYIIVPHGDNRKITRNSTYADLMNAFKK